MATTVGASRRYVSLRAILGAGLLFGSDFCAFAAQEIPPPAYQLAAQQAGVPSPVLYAVALQESGTQLRGRLIPWPWTLNVAGRSERYSTRRAACAGLHQALTHVAPARIDAGLGQVNLGFQTRHYNAPCELLDPYRNLAVAAQILREQHVQGEDWLLAVGRYHHPAGGARAVRYRQSVRQHLSGVLGADLCLAPTSSP
jgi:hypothetical protein